MELIARSRTLTLNRQTCVCGVWCVALECSRYSEILNRRAYSTWYYSSICTTINSK
jgi:hypothetical protein